MGRPKRVQLIRVAWHAVSVFVGLYLAIAHGFGFVDLPRWFVGFMLLLITIDGVNGLLAAYRDHLARKLSELANQEPDA